MSSKRKAPPSQGEGETPTRQIPQPVNVVDGIPDRCQHPRRWHHLAIAAAFLLWLAFLIYCAVTGRAS